MTPTVPRPEHPKPQFHRDTWANLNGPWQFAVDRNLTGVPGGWAEDPAHIDQQITVPFCPESALSGIHNTAMMPAVWYHRTWSMPDAWRDLRLFLHFGGVDFDCRAWVNGTPVGRHYGGGVSFSFEITHAVRPGDNDIAVCAIDDTPGGLQPLGKQSPRVYDESAWSTIYMRTTGIWQTVWVEARPGSHVASVDIRPDLDRSRFVLTPVFDRAAQDHRFRATLLSEHGAELQTATGPAASGLPIVLEVPDPRPWCPRDPHLYPLRLELLRDGQVVDRVESYGGLRKFHIEENRFVLNDEPIFLRFVLDQGFYPDGLWTAPTDTELKADIERSLAAGFNGARLHQKVFEERFHYWADRLGYLTMAESCNFGMTLNEPQAIRNHLSEWREMVVRDRNHPSIVAWTPFNESAHNPCDDFAVHGRVMEEIYDLTRTLDPTRPVHTVSGYIQVTETDIYSDHNYHQDPDVLAQDFRGLAPGAAWHQRHTKAPDLCAPYRGQPFFEAEYGGTFWDDDEIIGDDPRTWGYGKCRRDQAEEAAARGRWVWTDERPTAETILDAIEAMARFFLDHPHIAGCCWCQLTDIEGETNGIYTYDRRPKFDLAHLRAIFGAPAAIEQRISCESC